MELPQLRAILAPRELASFAKAGERLHLSPPAVFGQIRQLEEELGEKLNERLGKRLQLTATGELLAEYAKTIVQQNDDAVRALTGQGGGKRGLLRELPFLVLHRPVVIGSAVRRHCDDAGFTPAVLFESDQPDAIKELVKLGVGATVLPLWSVAQEASRGELRIIHPRRKRYYPFGWLHRRTAYPSKALSALLAAGARWAEWWPLAEYVLPAAGEDPRD